MEPKKHLNNHPLCQCRNSIKLRILEQVNLHYSDKPCLSSTLVDIVHEIVKKDNEDIEIDESFLKTYIMSIISEMVDNSLIGFKTIKKEELMSEFYFIRFDNDRLKKLLEQSAEIKNTSEEDKTSNTNSSRESSLNSVKNNSFINKSNLNCKVIGKGDYKQELIDKLTLLKSKLETLKKNNKKKELIDKLHKYNEIKDVGQELLGHIATNKGKMIKELYEELEISDDE